MKIAVIWAEDGRVVESFVFEGSLEDVVKDVAKQALEEWDPGRSDFIVVRDVQELTLSGEADEETLRELEERGLAKREDGQLRVLLQYYTISFDTELVDEEDYVDRKIYLVAPLVVPELREELEAHAASLTAERGEGPPGVREI